MVDGQPLHSHQGVVYGDEETTIGWGISKPFSGGGINQNPGSSRTPQNIPLRLHATTHYEGPTGTTRDHLSEKAMSIGAFTCQGKKETTRFYLSGIGSYLTNLHILPLWR